MSSGRIKKLIISFLLLLALQPVAAAEWSMQILMQQFATVESLSVHYHEEKHLSLLRMPLVSEGVLAYRRPDYLKKAMLKPERESFEADKGIINMTKDGILTRQIAISDYPPLTAFVAAYLALLSGNQNELVRYYEHELSGTEEHWDLVLKPKEKAIRQFVQEIIIRGSKNRIHSINNIDAEGDSTLMTLRNL